MIKIIFHIKCSLVYLAFGPNDDKNEILYNLSYFYFILSKNIIGHQMDQYKLEYEKGSGTFSVVFTALSLKTGKHVAIKCMKKKFDSL